MTLFYICLFGLVILFGLAIGSFLNVLVFRTHADIPITGRSKCLKCEEPIGWFDLIPVVSYLLLRGRCRRCSVAISWQYPLVEAATAIAFFLIALPLAAWHNLDELAMLALATFLAQAIMTIFLTIIFVYDLRFGYILDRFTVPAMVLAVVFNLTLMAPSTLVESPLSMVLGALAIGGFFLVQHLVSRGRWIGGGDIRMGIVMGLWLGLERGLVALFISYVLGAIVATGMILFKKKTLSSAVPFGTFLAVGTFIAMIWGSQILEWYMGYLR